MPTHHVTGGGARVNDEKVVDDAAILAKQDFGQDGRIKLSSGKKTHVLVMLNK